MSWARFSGLVCILAIAPAHSLEITDLRFPKRAELNRIEVHLRKVNAAIEAIDKAQTETKSLEKERRKAQTSGRFDQVQELDEQIEEQKGITKKALATKNKEGDAAIALAIATALEPRPWPEGITHDPLYPKSQTRWMIIARENEPLYWEDKDKNPIIFPPAKPNKRGRLPAARTLPNQLTVIHAKAFASAEDLILTVVHELNHYDLARDPKYPTQVGPEDEVKCYTLELDFLEHLPWGNTPEGNERKEDFRKLIDEVRQEKVDDVALAKAAKPRPQPALPEFEPAPSGIAVDLKPIQQRSKAIEKAAREHEEVRYLGYIWAFAKRVCTEEPPPFPAEYGMVILHPDRSIYRLRANKMHEEGFNASHCITKTYVGFLVELGAGQRELSPPHRTPTAAPPPPEPPTAPRVPDPPNVWAPKPRVPAEGEAALSDLVEKACANPGGFQSPADFSWFPAPGYRFSFGPRNPQDYCQRSLWDYLITLNAQGGKLDMQDVSHRAWGYRPRTPTPPSAPDCPRRVGDKCVPDLGD